MKRDKFYFISINLLRDKHKELIAWIKEQADEQESSISSFCINLMKKEYRRSHEENKVEQGEDSRGDTEA